MSSINFRNELSDLWVLKFFLFSPIGEGNIRNCIAIFRILASLIASPVPTPTNKTVPSKENTVILSKLPLLFLLKLAISLTGCLVELFTMKLPSQNCLTSLFGMKLYVFLGARAGRTFDPITTGNCLFGLFAVYFLGTIRIILVSSVLIGLLAVYISPVM
jgi:hypothetical protein